MNIDEVSKERIAISNIDPSDYKAISVALDILSLYRVINEYSISLDHKKLFRK